MHRERSPSATPPQAFRQFCRAPIWITAGIIVLATSGCTLLFGVDADQDPNLPTRDLRVRRGAGDNDVSTPSNLLDLLPGPGLDGSRSPSPVPTPEPSPEPDAPGIDLGASTLQWDAVPLSANLRDQAVVVATVVDTDGDPIEGIDLVASSATGLVFAAPTVRTDANGQATLVATTAIEGEHRITVTVGQNQALQLGTVVVRFDLCVSDATFYRDVVAGPVISKCLGCHNRYGRLQDDVATFDPNYVPPWGDSSIRGKLLLLFPDDDPIAMGLSGTADEVNLERLRSLSFLVESGLPYFIAKPTESLGHGGGEIFPVDSVEANLLLELSLRFENPSQCLPDTDVDIFEGVGLRDTHETLYKARVALTGEFPTPQELLAFGGTAQDLESELDTMLASDAFTKRLMEMYNDILQTDRNGAAATALGQLDSDLFPSPRRFFFRPTTTTNSGQACDPATESCCVNSGFSPAFCDAGFEYANLSISKEALALIEHVVSTQAPQTEILTADYTVVNPYSAAVYGLYENDDPLFDGTPDPYSSFFTTQLTPGPHNTMATAPVPLSVYPHAGILTTSTFLAKYGTSASNINRHRARTIYDIFLGIDVMDFLDLVIDPNEELPEHTFTEARSCAACHAALDPVAGTFKNFRNGNRFRPQSWFNNNDDIRPAGFAGETMPEEFESRGALQWLGRQIANDHRFALTQVKHIHELLNGTPALKLPTNPAQPNFAAQTAAFYAQNAYFLELANRFRGEWNFVLKDLIKAVVQGPMFRAKSPPAALRDEMREVMHEAGIGKGVIMTPEQIERRVESVIAFPYHQQMNRNAFKAITGRDGLSVYLGGIDNDDINERARDATPAVLNVIRRISSVSACTAVPQDFSIRDTSQRRLFQGIDTSTELTSESELQFREAIQHLAFFFWGTRPALDSDDVDEALDLFRAVQAAGVASIDAGTEGNNLPGPCSSFRPLGGGTNYDDEGTTGPSARVRVTSDPRYLVRAWIATAAFLMTDDRFWFE